jgi:hypothetical protein
MNIDLLAQLTIDKANEVNNLFRLSIVLLVNVLPRLTLFCY